MYSTNINRSLILEPTEERNNPLREVQTTRKAPNPEVRAQKLLPRRLSEFKKELEEAKNEPLVLNRESLEEIAESFDASEEELNDVLGEAYESEDTKPIEEFRERQVNFVFATPKQYSTPYKTTIPKIYAQQGKENRVQATISLTGSTKKSKAVNCSVFTPKRNDSNIGVTCLTSDTTDAKHSAVPSLSSSNDGKTLVVKGVAYLVLGQLGQGGSSTVYDCYDPTTGNSRAIKHVSLGDSASVAGYVNEVKMLEQLQKCPNIIKMYDYEQLKEKHELYVVLERGVTDLSKIIKHLAARHLPLHKLMYYWMEMLYAVQQIHKNGIVHCDLKPSNFIMDQEGTIKLIDFGISCSIQTDMTSAIKNVAEGSLNYISPESLRSSNSPNPNSPSYGTPKYKVNFKSDVWSLGCILYQLIYKKTPFQHIGHMYAKIAAILDDNCLIDYPAAEKIPAKVINTVKKCLIRNAKSRPSIEELISEYESFFF